MLEQAVKMEKDGEIYYTKQAELNMNNSLYKVCMLLAKEERRHAELLENKLNSRPVKLKKSETYSKVKNIFEATENLKSEVENITNQLDFYKYARENEQKSIDMYNDLLSLSGNDEDSDLFKFLIEQEKDHFMIMDEIVKMLTNAEQWVESAEFGTREDY